MMQKAIVDCVRYPLRWINQTRHIRPTVKIAQDKFQLTLDVRNFCKDEIHVKATTDYVVVEGKQERKLENGVVIRQFVRKFKLPEGCDPCKMDTKLSEEGVLTVIAHRNTCDQTTDCERNLKIDYTAPVKLRDAFVHVDDCCNPNPNEVCLEVREEKNKCQQSNSNPPDNQGGHNQPQ